MRAVRVLGKKGAVGNLFQLAHMLVGGVDGADADHAHGQDDQAQRGNDGINAAEDGKTRSFCLNILRTLATLVPAAGTITLQIVPHAARQRSYAST